MKHYKSDAFIRKIEVNLANVSAKPDDEFQLVKAYYDIDLFDCDLCGHKNCMYAYEVKNLQTGIVQKVGSERIHHFEGKGVDINLAEGLMRRVTSASNKARRDLKKRLGEEAFAALPQAEQDATSWYMRKDKIEDMGKIAYKALSNADKREMVVNEFLALQTRDLLTDVAVGKSILTEDDIQVILQLDMEEEMSKALESNKIITAKSQIKIIEDKALDNIRNADIAEITPQYILDVKTAIKAINPSHPMIWLDNAYNNRQDEEKRNNEINHEFEWLINYSGNNPTVRDIQAYLAKNRYISPAQQNLAFSLVEGESHPVSKEFDNKIEELHRGPYNKFVDSVYRQYKRKGYVSEKQKAAILRLYDKE
jgi:hypothetical protein